MSRVDCGTAPSASPTVTTTTAALSARERLSAANGRTHQTYHGTVQARVRTVASITTPAAPMSRSRRRATAARRGQHDDDEDDVGGRVARPPSPRRAGQEPREVGRAQRRHEPVLEAGRRQPVAEHAVDDVGDHRAHRDRAGERRRPPPRAEHDERDEAEQRELERDAGDDRSAGADVPQRRAERAAAHDQRDRAQRAQQHERVVVLAAEAVDEDERVEAREHEAALRRAAEAAASHHTSARHAERGGAATAFHVQYAPWSGRARARSRRA